MSAPRAVLVTGATTPLGVALIHRLLADPGVASVVAVALDPHPALPADPRVHFVPTDLCRERNVRQLLSGPGREHRVDTIVHAALHRAAHAEGGASRRLHVEATRLLLRLADAAPQLRTFVLRSDAGVYKVRATTPQLLREDHPLELAASAPQWVRDRVEADVIACACMGLDDLRVVVLRCAEIVAPSMGSQLLDWLSGRVCLRPFGFDPMINVLSLSDAARALHLAIRAPRSCLVNIPGADTLPLSATATLMGRSCHAVPGPLLAPAYAVRRRRAGAGFRWDTNAERFHFGAMLDGAAARAQLGYAPETSVDWGALGSS